jgi:hypothetical protein
MGFDIYVRMASPTVPSSDSLDNYCCRRTGHTTDSYPNFSDNAEHMLSEYLPESDSFFWFDHQSEDDK